MSFQLVLGSSGSGKSYILYKNIINESIKNRDNNYMIIVPEQFTMQTQRDLVTMHPRNGTMNIDILSFLRLSYRIFYEVGTEERIVLEDTGKCMVLRKAAEEKKEELKFLKGNLRKQGFISELKSILSEIYQYSITDDDLENIILKVSKKPVLEGKLKDLLTIYKSFKEVMGNKYIAAEEILDILYSVIEESEIIRNSTICFDGFTGFTPSQYKLLRRLMKFSKKVIVTVTIDPREEIDCLDEEFKLFHLSKKTINKLKSIAKEENVVIDETLWVNSKGSIPYRFRDSDELACLEYNLFRYPSEIYKGETKNIRIFEAQDSKTEAVYTIREILRLIREEGIRYRDIAIVTGDIGTYGRIYERELEVVKIPYFIDNKKDIISNPMVEFIRSGIDVIIRDFSYESVFRYLRCGLSYIEGADVDVLENYVIALGIRGFGMWNREWTGTLRSKSSINLEFINDLRRKVVDEFSDLYSIFRNKRVTVLEYTKGLYDFIIQHEVYDKLEDYINRFERENNLIMVKEYKQVYELVMNLFEKFTGLLGDEIMTAVEYNEILEAGFEEQKVGLIPPGTDQLVIGDIERTRLKDIKVLFFVGVNDGIIPKSNNKGGIISDTEREFLKSSDVELAPTKRQSAYTEQFYLYLNLTKPQRRLYITYSKTGTDGKALRPSYLVGKIKKIFPEIKVMTDSEEKLAADYIIGTDRGLGYLIEGLRNYPYKDMADEWKEVFTLYLNKEDFKEELIKLIEGAFYINDDNTLSKAAAKALYGVNLSNSVTRLEQYASCAFAHFLKYGLELEERQEYKLSVPDLGNVFHKAIDLFSKKLMKSSYDWNNIPDDIRNEYVKECVNEAVTGFKNSVLFSSKRNEYIINRIERMTKRTIWALCEQVKRGRFVPKEFEVQFSYLDSLDTVKIEISEEETIHLQGRIDRIDICEDEEKVYVKIIDYKSGNKSFDVVSLYHGLQLQLAVYLNAAMEFEKYKYADKEIIPAGIFYYNIDDPFVEKVPDIEEIEKNILKELKVNGVVNSDCETVKRLDRSFDSEGSSLAGGVKSDVIPVETNKDGSLTKRSSTISQRTIEGMIEFVDEKVKKLGKEMLEGNIKARPYKLGSSTACDYCSYRGVCGFDLKLSGNEYNKLKKLAADDVWECLTSNDKKGN